MKHMQKGFTLIELLVVVLIIGILAAVALPQYKIAVAKARISTMLPVIASIANSAETYYLANGQYPLGAEDLDVEFPAECTAISDTNRYFSCYRDFLVGLDYTGSINLDYCPDKNENWDTCSANRKIQISFRLQHFSSAPDQAGQKRCSILRDTKFSRAICSGLSGLYCPSC